MNGPYCMVHKQAIWFEIIRQKFLISKQLFRWILFWLSKFSTGIYYPAMILSVKPKSIWKIVFIQNIEQLAVLVNVLQCKYFLIYF